ncbi:hypothetical protein ACE193_00685 [Bernardetia sp. OM2101]|uniref:hypothetical protein n=1 Tax=Bernardetia sp. OM2101 TaxID=3344876 RepID=UPI0035D049F2
MIKFIKFIWMLSMLAVMGVLLYENVILQPPVSIKIDDAGGVFNLSKNGFFYLFLAAIVVFNGILLILGTVIPTLPKKFLPIPKRNFWSKNQTTRRMLLKNFKLWTKGIGIFINLFIMIYLVSIQIENGATPQFPFNPSILSTIVLTLLVGWLFLFFAWFGMNATAVEKMRVEPQN